MFAFNGRGMFLFKLELDSLIGQSGKVGRSGQVFLYGSHHFVLFDRFFSSLMTHMNVSLKVSDSNHMLLFRSILLNFYEISVFIKPTLT